jgi:hypothetical protein
MSQGTEDTLLAMRALEEKAELLRRMAARSERKAAACYQEVAEMRANPFLGHPRNIAIAPSFPAARATGNAKLRLRASPFLPLHL